MVILRTPFTAFGVVRNEFGPVDLFMDGTSADYLIEPYIPLFFEDNAWWFRVTIKKDRAAIYEGPGPVELIDTKPRGIPVH